MSVPYRGQAQPQDHQQQQYHDYDQSQQYGQDPTYTHYAGAPFQQQQQGYYPPQQYPTTIPYANHTQASFNPYSQHVQHAAPSYHAQSQSFAPPNGLGYQSAIRQGGYLGANDFGPPSHVTQGSLSSGHSPGSSTGHSRLSTLVYPSQGPSPSLESQVSHLSLVGPAASLPSKPLSHGTSHAAARHAQSSHPHAPVTASAPGESRSDISLRYPPLPSIPERCATPPSLRPEADAATEAVTMEKSVLNYISSLRSIIDAYEKRDEHLRMRTEAVGFQPKQAWAAWESTGAEDSSHHTANTAEPPANPILGVRLLQRLDKLQRENDELGALLASGARADASSSSAETEELRKEVHDCHQLIAAMDKALSEAEGRASASERALEAACRTNSTAMLPVKQGPASTKGAAHAGNAEAQTTRGSVQDAKKPSPNPTNASAARRASKPAISSSSPTAGASGKAASQQRGAKPNQSAARTGGNGGAARTTGNDKSAAPTADGKTGKPPSSSAAAKGK